MIHVLLVEDKNMSRETMGGYIKRSGRYELTASITNAGMAEMACMRYAIDLILMDVCTDNNESGLAAAAVIKRHFPKIKIIVVTSMADSDFMRKAREAGAESFWFKETGEIGLLELMDRTMAGESVYPGKGPVVKIGRALSSEFTPDELTLMRLLVQGKSLSAVARELIIAEGTASAEMHISVDAVRWHIKELFSKTGYNNRVALACDVINKDLIVPGF